MRNIVKLQLSSALVFFLPISSIASAQDASSRIAPAPVADNTDSQDIVVTALKRSQNLQDIPAAVSALSGEDLRARGVVSIQNLAQAVPSVNFGEHVGVTLITIRGVGSTVETGVTEPTVATYVDGVFLPRATMGFLRAVDLDRIEVLRGPQGTIYGRNATGGAINFISAAPTQTLTAGVNLSAGSRNAFSGSGFVSGPLSDDLSVRVSGGHDQDDGYVRFLPNKGQIANINVDYVRGALRYAPSKGLTVDLSARYEKSTGANAYQQLLTPSPLPAPQSIKPNEIYGNSPYGNRTETLVLAGTIKADLSDTITLKSVTSYVDHKSSVDSDIDATDFPGLYLTDYSRPSKSYGQELNLIGDGGPLKWILGAYYFHEKAGNSLPLGIGAGFASGFGVPADTYLTQSVGTRTESVAVFADATYSLSDTLRLNLGLRYNHEKKDFNQNLSLTLPSGTVVPLASDVLTNTTTNQLLPKVNLQFDVADNVHTYVQWSRGFKSGGQNLPGGSGENLGSVGLYRPETLDAYEIGLKTQTADRRITANFAAFYYEYKNLQLTITQPPATSLVQNAPARIYGLESDFAFRVTTAFKITASANLLHARFKKFLAFDDAQPALGTQNLNGRSLPHAPDLAVNLGAEYRISLGSGLLSSLTLRGDIYHTSRVVLRYFGADNDSQKAYTLGNLAMTFARPDDKLQLRLFVNNVGDTLYRQNSSYLGAIGSYFGNYNPPRTWGAALSYRY